MAGFVGHVGGCGVTDEVVQWMERIQNSGVDDEPTTTPMHSPAPSQPHPNSLRDDTTRYGIINEHD